MDSVGFVGPCNFFTGEDWRGTNIRHRDFLDIWLHGEAFNKLRSLPGNQQCRTCRYNTACRGGCRAAALYLKGDLNAPDEHCVFYEEF
ncbi:MAG: SPASM domain-containing protein [Armatimonadetes bacterium]|nr:SPASM domain-containing protein [Armatimonadota bacterium]